MPASDSVPDPVPDPVPVPEGARTPHFDHERLDVYRAAIAFVANADELAAHLPRGRNYLSDQLQRAAISVPLNIAEGVGEFSRRDKSRLYRIALRSATECAAILDVCRLLNLVDQRTLDTSRDLLLRIVSMQTRMVRSGTGTGTGTGKKPASA
jgi:four helix bundle protein